jgi:acyl-CoA synthetase (NDP forming)
MQNADILSRARKEGRALLSYEEGKQILQDCGVPVAPWVAARDRAEVKEACRIIGFPMVMKVLSPDVVHKTDIGGVVADLRTEEEAGLAFDRIMGNLKEMKPAARLNGVVVEKRIEGLEVVIGATKDAQFGPVLMFGMGGVWVEFLKDVSFRLIPVEPADAEEMIREVKGYSLLQGFRGKRADIETLRDILLNVSSLVSRHPEIAEIDLNPVITSPSGSVAADVRIQLVSA